MQSLHLSLLRSVSPPGFDHGLSSDEELRLREWLDFDQTAEGDQLLGSGHPTLQPISLSPRPLIHSSLQLSHHHPHFDLPTLTTEHHSPRSDGLDRLERSASMTAIAPTTIPLELGPIIDHHHCDLSHLFLQTHSLGTTELLPTGADLSLDPSTIMAYPDDQEQPPSPSAAQPTTNVPPSHPDFQPHPVVPINNNTAKSDPSLANSLPTTTYPLDPLLVSASIPPRRPSHQANLTPATDYTHPWATHDRRSVSQPQAPHQRQDDDHHMHSPTRSAHSRSSSALPSINGQMITDHPPRSPSCASHKRTQSHPHPLVEVPDWDDKPTPEEYKMLSSKEKRQLRNKISARNFRHRRKEHITALEQQVAQRDKTIESLSQDLSVVKMENKELKAEVEVLKTKWTDLMNKIEEMSLGASYPISTSSSVGSSASTSAPIPLSPRSKSMKSSNNTIFPRPNLHKDLGSHSRKPFNGVGSMPGGNVGVHTTLIPETPINVYQRTPSARAPVMELSKLVTEILSPQALLEIKHQQTHQKPKESVGLINELLNKVIEDRQEEEAGLGNSEEKEIIESLIQSLKCEESLNFWEGIKDEFLKIELHESYDYSNCIEKFNQLEIEVRN